MNKIPLSKDEIKMRRKALSDGNRKHTPELVEVPKSEWPKRDETDKIPSEVYRSNKFFVMIFEENNCHRITVNRTAINSDGSWKDGITWDELQEIKRLVGFADKDAIEIYPADHDIVNVSNMRHLWVMPSKIGCAWRNKAPEPPKDRSMGDLVREAKREYVGRFGKDPDSVKLVSKLYHQLRGEMKADKVELFDGMRVIEVENDSLLGKADISFGHDDPAKEDPDFRKPINPANPE